MEMHYLGKTGIMVSEFCLGTGNFGGVGFFKTTGEIGQKDADFLVDTAIDKGINFFDTAEIYSYGLAEEILGKALGPKRKSVIITTKIDYRERGRLSRSRVIEACNASLKRLDTDYIDLLQPHDFDRYTPMEETLRALDDLVRQGKVRYIGCSNFTAWQVMKALAISDKHDWEKFAAMECHYSLLARGIEFEVVPLCLDQGLGMLAWSPLHGGFLSGKYRRGQPWPEGTRLKTPNDIFVPVPYDRELGFDIVDELDRIANDHQASVAQAALNFIRQKPWITSTIIGARTADQLLANIKATDWKLLPEEISRLNKLSEPRYLYPYGKVEQQ